MHPADYHGKHWKRKQTDTRSVRSLSLQGGSGSIQCPSFSPEPKDRGPGRGAVGKKKRSESSQFAPQLLGGAWGSGVLERGCYGALERLSAPGPVGWGLGHHGHQMLPGGFPVTAAQRRGRRMCFLSQGLPRRLSC